MKIEIEEPKREVEGNYSVYARDFKQSAMCETNKDWNMVFLMSQERYMNDKLNAYGYLFLNEVFDMLGLSRTAAGQIIGWTKNNSNGDGYIKFIIDGTIIDFNVDGEILTKIEES